MALHPSGIASRSAIATAGRILGRALGYLTQIYLARLLAPQGFGLFAIGWTLLRLFSIAGHLGLDFGVIKFGSQYWQKDVHKLRSVVLISLAGAMLSGIASGYVLYTSAAWLAETFFNKPDLIPILRSLAVAFPFATTLRVMAATGSLSGRMGGSALVEDIAQPVFQLILFLALHKVSDPLSAALLSTVLSYGMALILGFFYVGRVIPGLISFQPPSLSDASSLFRYSLSAIAAATLGAFNLWGDRLLVGYFGTEADAGIYQSISVITVFTTILLSGFKISAAPVVARMHHEGNLMGIKSITQSFTRWVMYLSSPILLVVFMHARVIIIMIFGEEYEGGTTALLILTIGQFFYIATGIADQVFLMTGGQRTWLRISSLIFLLTIMLDAILVPRLHVIGAGIVSSVMMLLMSILSAIILRNRFQFWILDVSQAKMILAALFTGMIIHFLDFNVDAPLELLMTSALTALLFGVFVFILGLHQHDRAVLQKLLKRIKEPRS